MERRGWARWPSLFGVVFVVVAALRLWVIGGDLPAVDASGREVIAFYDENAARETAASVIALVAALFLILFAAHVRRIILAAEGPPGYLAAVFFAGAIILATAIAVGEALHGVLAFDPTELTPAAAEAINALDRSSSSRPRSDSAFSCSAPDSRSCGCGFCPRGSAGSGSCSR